MRTYSICGKTVTIFSCGIPDAPVVYLNTGSEDPRQILQAVQATGAPPFTLVSISDLDWDHDLAPWDAPAAFKNSKPFVGGANAYLQILAEEIIPRVEKESPASPLWRGIAGYSLAGLFAIYALYQTDTFSRAASVSGSLWFPGMKEYVFSHQWRQPPDCVYFSLGDRESKTRNSCLRDVQRNTGEIEALYRSKRTDTVFRMEPGNHFERAVERTAAGIAWLLQR